MSSKQITAVHIAVIIAAAILSAAFMLRPKPAPMTAEQACVAKGGTWVDNPPTGNSYIDSINGGPHCVGGSS